MSKSISRTETFKNTVTTKTKGKNYSDTHTVSTTVFSSGPRSLSASNVIRIVSLVLLLLSIFSILFGSHTIFGVQTLLNVIEDMPSGDISSITNSVRIPEIIGDWGIFDGLRGFINTFTGILNTIVSFACFVGDGFFQLQQFIFVLLSHL